MRCKSRFAWVCPGPWPRSIWIQCPSGSGSGPSVPVLVVLCECEFSHLWRYFCEKTRESLSGIDNMAVFSATSSFFLSLYKCSHFFFFSLRLPLTCSLLLGLFAFTFSLSYFLQIHEKKDTNEKSSRDMLWAQVPVQLGKTFLLNGGYCFHSFLRLIPLDGPETSTGSAGHSTEWVWRHSLC